MRRLLAALLILAACASGSSTPIDQVTGLTVLAIKADPPDQIVVTDAGVYGLGCSASTDSCPPSGLGLTDAGATAGPVRPVTITALVADPVDAGQNIQIVFSTCAQLDATTQQCLGGSPDYEVIGSGAYGQDAGPAVVASATFTPGEALLADALALDPLHGFGYLPLHVQVTASAGGAQIVATKTLTFSQPVALPASVLGIDAGGPLLQPPDVNPTMPPITLDGVTWSATGPPSALGASTTIEPAPQASGALYLIPQLDGGLLPFTDFWSYEFYCSAGTFSSPRSGGGPRPFSFGLDRRDAGTPVTNDAGETIPGTQVQWNADAGEPSGLVYYWIVVVDGRGGIDFAQRIARFDGP